MQLSCDEISGAVFRPFFEQVWTPERLESAVASARGASVEAFQRRSDGDHFTLYWQSGGSWFAAGLQNERLLYVNLGFESEQLTIGQVVICLGAPEAYQAWCNVYVGHGISIVQGAFVFARRLAIAYATRHLPYALEGPPALDGAMPVQHIALFGRQWADDERVLARSRPWPGDWKDLEVDFVRDEDPDEDTEGGSDATAAASIEAVPIEEALRTVAEAFDRAPRPPDDELLHPDARDDGDIKDLYGVPRWQELPDAAIEGQYAALYFLSAAGFRHFLPAYMSWVLRHPESPAAVVDSTLFALTPARGGLHAFSLSKFALFDAAQRSAVVAFLAALSPYHDVSGPLAYWRTG